MSEPIEITEVRVGDDVEMVIDTQHLPDGSVVTVFANTNETDQIVFNGQALVTGGQVRVPWKVDVGDHPLPVHVEFAAQHGDAWAGSGKLRVLPSEHLYLASWEGSAEVAMIRDAPPPTRSSRQLVERETMLIQVDLGHQDGDELDRPFDLDVQLEAEGPDGTFAAIDHPDARSSHSVGEGEHASTQVPVTVGRFGQEGVVPLRAVFTLRPTGGEAAAGPGSRSALAPQRPGAGEGNVGGPKPGGPRRTPTVFVSPLPFVGPPPPPDVQPPRLLWSINMSPAGRAARAAAPKASVVGDAFAVAKAMIEHISAACQNQDAIPKIMDDPAHEYIQPGIDPKSDAEKWARLVARHMSGMPYINPDMTYDSGWEERFVQTGEYPIGVLCQHSVGLSLLFGGWQGFPKFGGGRLRAVDGTESMAASLQKHNDAIAGKSTFSKSLDLDKVRPGTVFIWGTPVKFLTNNGVFGNVGHDAICLRKPPPGAFIDGKVAHGQFQMWDTYGASRGKPALSAFGDPHLLGGGVYEEMWTTSISGKMDFKKQNLPMLPPPARKGAYKILDCESTFQGHGALRMQDGDNDYGIMRPLSPPQGKFRPRGILRLVIMRRDPKAGRNRTPLTRKNLVYASSWLSMGEASMPLPISQLFFALRGIPGADEYEAAFWVHADRENSSRALLDIFCSVDAGGVIKDRQDDPRRLGNDPAQYVPDDERFANLGPEHGDAITSDQMATLNALLDQNGFRALRKDDIFFSHGFRPHPDPVQDTATEVAAEGGRVGFDIVAIGEHGNHDTRVSQIMVMWPGARHLPQFKTAVQVWSCELGGQSSQPFGKLLRQTTFADIRQGHRLEYCGIHSQRYRVLDWTPIDAGASLSGDKANWHLWDYLPKGPQPIPSSYIQGKYGPPNWTTIGDFHRIAFLDSGKPWDPTAPCHVVVWKVNGPPVNPGTPDEDVVGTFRVYRFDPNNKNPKWDDLIPNPTIQRGLWQPFKLPTQLVHIEGDRIIDWRPIGGLDQAKARLWQYVRTPGQDPLGTLITEADLHAPADSRLVYLGHNRVMAYNATHHAVWKIKR